MKNDVIKYLASGHDGITIENETPRDMSSISNDMALLNAYDSINVQQEKIIENGTVDSEPENEARPRDNDQGGVAINASNHINSELSKEGASSDVMVTENLYSITNILKTWALSETNVPKSSVSNLLRQLHRIHNELPKSFHSLLPRPQLSYQNMQEGLYVHFPNWTKCLKDALCYFYRNLITDIAIEYYLIINIDGLPLFEHSPDYKIYPILVSIYKTKMQPICAGIYCSEKSTNREMPPSNVFLQKFLDDLSVLKSQSILYKASCFTLANYGIYVCDAPARSSLKRIKQHCGYNACERCVVTGEYDSFSRHVCFTQTNCKKRTNQDFQLQIDQQHHNGVSILTATNVNMIDDFPLDYVHLCCRGVMKRLLMWWKGVKR